MTILVYYGVEDDQYTLLVRWYQWWIIIIVLFLAILQRNSIIEKID